MAVGLLGYGAQISLTHGLRSAKAAPAIATSYLSVVWGVLAGYFLFHEVRHQGFGCRALGCRESPSFRGVAASVG